MKLNLLSINYLVLLIFFRLEEIQLQMEVAPLATPEPDEDQPKVQPKGANSAMR